MQVFDDRKDAGRQLAAALRKAPELQGADRLVVLAIPRGGLPVGAEVARELKADFDVVVVRKLRTPHNPELGFGAVGPDGHADVDDDLVTRLGLSDEQVQAEVRDRQEAVAKRLELYRSVSPAVDLAGAAVVIVDDGIATGGTARHACALARRSGAETVILAVPVAPRGVVEELSDVADTVLVLSTPAEFLAVGQAYRDFSQLDDDEILVHLRVASRQA